MLSSIRAAEGWACSEGIMRRKKSSGTTVHTAYCLPASLLCAHLGNEHLLSTYCLLGVVLDTGNAVVIKTRGAGHRWQNR